MNPRTADSVPPDVKRFMDAIEASARRAFPDGTFKWKGSRSLASSRKPNAIYIQMTTTDTWANGIRENDPSYSTWWIHEAYTDEGLLPVLTIEMSQGGKVYAPGFGSGTKVGWRNRTGTPAQIISHMQTYFARLKTIFEAVVGKTASQRVASQWFQQGGFLRTAGKSYYELQDGLSPMSDLPAYTEALLEMFLLPYPAIWNTLGVEKNEVQSRASVQGEKGVITFKSSKAKASIKIVISPNGDHIVAGTARGIRLPATKFKYRTPVSGVHRGTQGQILNWLEDLLPSKAIYRVFGVGVRPQVFDNVEDLVRQFPQAGTNDQGMKALRGQPRLKGLAGPMFDGRDGDLVSIRYETWELHESLSV